MSFFKKIKLNQFNYRNKFTPVLLYYIYVRNKIRNKCKADVRKGEYGQSDIAQDHKQEVGKLKVVVLGAKSQNVYERAGHDCCFIGDIFFDESI